MHDSTIFHEEEMLQRLQQDREVARLIIENFIDDIPKQLLKLNDAIKEGSAEDIHLKAHAIKGAALMVGGNMLSRAAKDLEMAARSDNLQQADRLFGVVQEQFFLLKNRLEVSGWIN